MHDSRMHFSSISNMVWFVRHKICIHDWCSQIQWPYPVTSYCRECQEIFCVCVCVCVCFNARRALISWPCGEHSWLMLLRFCACDSSLWNRADCMYKGERIYQRIQVRKHAFCSAWYLLRELLKCASHTWMSAHTLMSKIFCSID